ncbi:iron-siderophore ABC transporter substrate-binding protein [Palleronia sp.]|uniref:iron-siderophore ABC transporter substrate-binding protein n=1 Tax=Palleronia sp. TaxID=1940284 RepID=UPI0035C8347F
MIRALALLFAILAGATSAQPTFDTPPERVVTLDWALTEDVIELGLTPVGAPELELYKEWVGDPAIPEGVADIGLRTEPNLETIAGLVPDVILASDLDPAQVETLSRIAPVMNIDAWRADHDNIAAARKTFLQLADLFDRRSESEARLARMEARLDQIATRVAEMDVPEEATAIRLNDNSTVWIYGENSVPNYTLRRIGLTPEIDLPATRWGVVQKPLDALAEADDGVVLAIRPHMGGAAAKEGPLWSALPMVANDRFAEVDRVWSYGGILSVERHAEAFLAALEPLTE